MSAWVARHRKLIVSVIGAVITVVIQVWGTTNPWVLGVMVAATAAGVYRAPNEPQAAPAGPALPSSSPAGGGTGTVRLVPGPEPEPVQERVGQPPPPGTGVRGASPSGAVFTQRYYPPGPGWRRW